MTRGANVSKELNRLRNEANQFAAENLRPAALALDRMNDPKEVIAPSSPLWEALRGAYSLQYHAAEMPKQLGGLGLSGAEIEVAFEELGWGSVGLASALLMSSIPFTSAGQRRMPTWWKALPGLSRATAAHRWLDAGR